MSQARKLEAELDTKLAAYAKLCSSFDSGFTRGEAGLAADQVPAQYEYMSRIRGRSKTLCPEVTLL